MVDQHRRIDQVWNWSWRDDTIMIISVLVLRKVSFLSVLDCIMAMWWSSFDSKLEVTVSLLASVSIADGRSNVVDPADVSVILNWNVSSRSDHWPRFFQGMWGAARKYITHTGARPCNGTIERSKSNYTVPPAHLFEGLVWELWEAPNQGSCTWFWGIYWPLLCNCLTLRSWVFSMIQCIDRRKWTQFVLPFSSRLTLLV